ncbi:MAG: response regulator transcription factor, partial [Pyrinomonadaceae bacterium]
IVDDDEELCELVSEYLTAEGFHSTCVHDGEKGLEGARSGNFDLAILDVMLPKMSGFEVLKKLREISNLPIIMLTARGDDADRIGGLESGADDYLPKPFNPRELVARLKAIMRRILPDDEIQERIAVDDLQLSHSARSAIRGAVDLGLTSVEFDLLAALLRRAGTIMRKEELSEQVLDRELSPYDRSLDMHISNLRKKLGPRTDGSERIKTIRSVGYIYTI